MSNALVVIDVQNHFAVENAADLPQKILKHINTSHYDFVVFTKFRNTSDSNFYKILNYTDATGPPETDIHPVLAPLSNINNTFEKHTYSAFKQPELVSFLKNNEVDELFLCGIDIDGCVLATAYEAFDLGYKFQIIEELSSVGSSIKDYEQSAKTIITRNLKRKRS